MSKKGSNNMLMYLALGGAAYLLLSKKTTTVTTPTTVAPGATATTIPSATTAASANPITSLATSLANLLKGTQTPATPAATPVSQTPAGSGNSTMDASSIVDSSSLLNLQPLQPTPTTNYTSSYDPLASAPDTSLDLDTSCVNCFESVDDGISGVRVGLVQVNPNASVSNVVQSLVNSPVSPQQNAQIPVPSASSCCSKGSLIAGLVAESL